MHNKPFRFLDSPQSLRELRQALGQVGLSEVETAKQEAADEPNPYHPASLRFACCWLSKSVEIHWHYYWWPDGVYSELGRVSVVYEGVVRREVNVEELLRQQVGRPLVEVIIHDIVAACAKVTGKSGRTS